MNPANADAPSTGRKYWRSLSELEGNPEFEDYLRREFPVSGDQFPDNLSRRRWLQLMGASLTLAGAVGCRYEKEIIAPFAQRPKNRIPGKPQKFATTIEYAGAARPLLMTCFDGRPLKPEGNPEHPESNGGTDLYSQAATLELYDPDRARTGYEIVDGRAEELDEDETRRRAKTFFSALRGGQAGTTVVLTETTSSPTLARLMGELAGSNVEWVQYSPVTDDNERAGLKQVFGADLVARPLLDRAQIVLTLDRDFMAAYEGATVKLQRDFIAGRNADERRMNRLYAVESQLSITGMKADHRLAIRSSLIGSFLGQLFGEVQRLKSEGFEGYAEEVVEREGDELERPTLFFAALAEDLAANQGAAVVLVGKNQPPEVHALAARLNDLIGATGATLEYRPAPNPRPVCVEAIAQLADRLNAGDVENLVVIGGNPAYDAPSDVDFGAAMEQAGNVVRLGMWVDETSLRSDLHLPALHPFETWGDVISEYGVWSISQPMIAPLHFGWSAIEFAGEALGAEANGQPADAQALVRETARGAVGVAGEIAWRGIVRDGFVRDSAAAAESASPTGEAELTGLLDPTLWEEDSRVVNDSIELSFIPSRTLYDGRFGNNGWLQEFPDPVSKVTWDNVLYVNWATANALGLKQGVLARIGVSGSEIVAPVFIQPGQADGSVAIALGYGRKSAGKIGGSLVEGIDPVGHDVAPVRRSDAWWFATDVKVASEGTSYVIATTQDHNAIDTTGLAETARRAPVLIRNGTYADYLAFLDEGADHPHGEAEAKGGDSPTAPIDETSPSVEAHDEAHEHDHDHDHEHEGDAHAHEDEHGGHHRQFPPQPGHHPELVSLWTEWSYEGQAWGMAIDLNRCTGCSACAVACQAENNVPIVGKDQVARGREMHWMRIDRYFSGDPSHPSAHIQPMLCQQCENAPCESVCPVAATVHSTEGLNDMVYNRCIGTRYCGNNCPYKVRRFNYLWYRGNPRLNQDDGDLTNLVLNPEVTVRTRGVMEKCTFCVQRIQNAKIDARATARRLGANEIQTACQQACPTDAIVFGDLNREDSRAAQLHRSPRAYALLEELNIKPRNRYLSEIRNPHPTMVAAKMV